MNSVFPGTNQERDELLASLSHYCTCGSGAKKAGTLSGRCAGHTALLGDRDWLNAQLFYRSQRARLIAGEFKETPPPCSTS
jgi:hypothetical protein